MSAGARSGTWSGRNSTAGRAVLAGAAAVTMIGSVLLGATPAHAAEIVVDGMRFSFDDSDPGAGATLTTYEGSATSVVIPSALSIDGTLISVTTIGVEAFMGAGLTSVSIPVGVTAIGEGAFAENALTSVDLPGNLESLGAIAFAENQLSSITIPPSVTSLGNGVFAINQLTSVTIPPSITVIPANAFAANRLTSVSLPDTITEIRSRAFRSNELATFDIPPLVAEIGPEAFTTNRFTSLAFPDTLRIIGSLAFADNPLLTSVSLGDGVTHVGRGAFAEVQSDDGTLACNISTVDFGSSLLEIGDIAFQGCKLTSVEFPESLRQIGLSAFTGNGLTSIAIPDGLERVLALAFSYNDIESVTIPASVTFMGPTVFRGNPLASVKFLGAAPGHNGGPLLHTFLEDVDGLLVDYYWRHGVAAGVDGGFTAPEWEGYRMRAIAIVDFDLHGHGDPLPFAETPVGGTVPSPTSPVADGWSFRGWYADAAYTTLFEFSAALTRDAVAHAKWSADVGISTDLASDEIAVEGRTFHVRTVVSGIDATAATPQGTVQFSIDGEPLGGPVTLDGDGAAQVEVPGTAAGVHRIQVAYTPASDAWGAHDDEVDVTVLTIEAATAAIELDASALEVDEGDTVTLVTTAFDANGDELGDVSDLTAYRSSVATDVFDGTTVRFPTASIHTITASFAGAEATLDITVVAAPSPTPSPTPQPTGDPLADTGVEALPLLTVALLVLLVGGGALLARRRHLLG